MTVIDYRRWEWLKIKWNAEQLRTHADGFSLKDIAALLGVPVVRFRRMATAGTAETWAARSAMRRLGGCKDTTTLQNLRLWAQKSLENPLVTDESVRLVLQEVVKRSSWWKPSDPPRDWLEDFGEITDRVCTHEGHGGFHHHDMKGRCACGHHNKATRPAIGKEEVWR